MAPDLQAALGPKIEQVLELPPAPLLCNGDAASLRLSIMNIVLNARDAMPAGGRFRLRLAGDDRVVARAWRGRRSPRGMPGWSWPIAAGASGPSTSPGCFSRSSPPSPSARAGDLGLAGGLWHRGPARPAGSRRKANGASARSSGSTCRSPRRRPSRPRRPGTPRPPAKRTGRVRILYIEDDEDVRRFIGRALGLMGYEVFAAGDGRRKRSASGPRRRTRSISSSPT